LESKRLSGRRGFLEIAESILRNVSKGCRKTHIMYAANLNWKQLNRYLSFLEEKNFIRYRDSTEEYELTKKGAELLKVCESLRRLLS